MNVFWNCCSLRIRPSHWNLFFMLQVLSILQILNIMNLTNSTCWICHQHSIWNICSIHLSRPHYNVNLQSIAVNGRTLSIDSSVFATSSNRGTIIDSGTTLAYLAEEAYDPFVTAVSFKRGYIQFLVKWCNQWNLYHYLQLKHYSQALHITIS